MIIKVIKELRDRFGKQKRKHSVSRIPEELTEFVRE